NRFEWHELGDLGHVRADLFHRLQLFRREDDVLVLRELVALHDVFARDDDLLLDADVLLLEPRAAGLVQHVEGDRLARLGGRKQLHRDRYEPERDGQTCDRSCSHHASRLRGAASWTREYLNVFRNLQASARGFRERTLEAMLLSQHIVPAIAGPGEP